MSPKMDILIGNLLEGIKLTIAEASFAKLRTTAEIFGKEIFPAVDQQGEYSDAARKVTRPPSRPAGVHDSCS